MSAAVLAPSVAKRWGRRLPLGSFLLVFVLHALYVRHLSTPVSGGWADAVADNSARGFGPYLQTQDYFLGFSYALGTAFSIWAVVRFLRQRERSRARGAVGSVTLMGLLMAGGCFMIGCCGSPMLGVYLSLFGAKALGVGKPLMAVIALLSTGCGYVILSRRFAKDSCGDKCC